MTQGQGSPSVVGTTVEIAGFTLASVSAAPTPADAGITVVPAPIAAADLPAVMDLLGVAA